MKILFVLIIALFLSLVSPAFCQPPDGPDIFSDEHTRKLARELDLKTVTSVQFDGSSGIVIVTDPKLIASVVDGLKTAYTTNFTNKVNYVLVNGRDERTLIEYRFSISNFPEISPELGDGLKAAGAKMEGWEEWSEQRRRNEALDKKARELLKWALPLMILSGLAFFVFKRRTQVQR